MTVKLPSVIAALLFTLSMSANSTPITSFLDPALAGAQTINFDSYTTNKYLNDFSVDVVNFHNERSSGNYFASNATLPGHSGRHIGLYDQGYISFDGGVDAVAFSLGAFNTNWIIQAFSSTGSLLESLTINNPICCRPSVYGFATDNIWAVRLKSTIAITYGDVIVMDDFKYVKSAPISVPEPSAWALFLLGLTGLYFSRQRALGKKEFSTK